MQVVLISLLSILFASVCVSLIVILIVKLSSQSNDDCSVCNGNLNTQSICKGAVNTCLQLKCSLSSGDWHFRSLKHNFTIDKSINDYYIEKNALKIKKLSRKNYGKNRYLYQNDIHESCGFDIFVYGITILIILGLSEN